MGGAGDSKRKLSAFSCLSAIKYAVQKTQKVDITRCHIKTAPKVTVDYGM